MNIESTTWRGATALSAVLLTGLVSGTSFAQAPPAPDAHSSATAPEASAAPSAVPFAANPQPFASGRRPHVIPMHSPEYFQNAPPPPAFANLIYYGGRVVSNLQVVQVIWGSGSYLPEVTSTSTPSIASFYQEVLNSSYVDWLSEYDTTGLPAPTSNQTIGRGSFLHQYVITPSTKATTVDDTTIQAEISAQIAAGHLPAPTTDGNGNTNTYYAVYFPNGITITLQGTGSCMPGGFCAYHGTIAPSGSLRELFYGVHPDMQVGTGCDVGCGPSSPFGNTTSVASHEMTETITDAEVGLAANVAPPLAWYDFFNGEIGDICNGQQGTVTGADGVTYTVQTEWSNAQGACVVKGANSGPLYTLTPATLPFAHQYVYETSLAQVATVANTGGVALPKPTITITGTDHASFSKATTCVGTVALSKSCTISVKFEPTTTGTKTATLTVSVSGAATETIALTGTGIAAPFTLSPRALAFGNCAHGTTCKASTAITVKNTGTAALPISSLTLNGANHTLFSKTTTCGTSVAVGKTCTISVTFSPTTTGSATASLSVNTGGGDGTQTVALSGKGT